MAESTALWLLMILFVLTFTVVSSIDDKCAACNAVAEEIEYGLSNEKPRNHLDMRHRLDSKGQRKGKVIDYRVSELRVVELLDGLCDKMQDYTLEKVETKRYEWVRVDSWDNLSVKNGIGIPKDFTILSFLGFGIPPLSLVNWLTLLVVNLMTSKRLRHIQKIYHLIVEGYWRKQKMSWQN